MKEKDKKTKKNKERVKGITLIALVITIIVLLILAGVTISTLTGDNGILGKASMAKEKQDISDNQKNGFNLLCEVVFDKLNMLANEEETTVLSYGKRKDAFGFMCEKINGEEMNTIRNLLLDITPDNTTSIS